MQHETTQCLFSTSGAKQSRQKFKGTEQSNVKDTRLENTFFENDINLKSNLCREIMH